MSEGKSTDEWLDEYFKQQEELKRLIRERVNAKAK
jgi:hypothetical protein